ncbi:MAG: histidine triad nucleotide-binding protein [Thermodesulfobacteriota bacterium]
MDDCLFCKIADGRIRGDMVYQDDKTVVFKDINPQAPTHLLVVPREHIPMVADMTERQSELVGRLFYVAAEVCRKGGISDYRLVINNGQGVGQTVFHVHLHVLAGRPFHWPPG